MENVIVLNEDYFLGEGRHKLVFRHPKDNGKCIKIMKDSSDKELERELKYHKAMAKRGKKLSMLVKYFGEVQTNYGKGYMFERVVDFDGKCSMELTAIFEDTKNTEKILGCNVQTVMDKFKELCFKEMPVVSNMDPYNFMIQRLSTSEFTIRVVDNIGSPVHIPLAYYFDYFASRHIKKYWQRFEENYSAKYPEAFGRNITK